MYGKIAQHQAYTVICFGQLNADNVTSSSQVTLTVKNLPTYARDSGSIPGWRTKIPHAAGQLSPMQPNT